MTERYQRHSLIDWFDQETLQAARIVVVGAGAVGNEVVKNLTLLGVGKIHIFDFDTIEEHNLTRSILFRDGHIGRYKAEVAAEACREIDPNIDVKFSAVDFWEGLTLSEVGKADGVVCCVDNFEARIKLNQLCLLMGTDFYNTGIDSRNVTAEVYPFSTEPDCACYECTLPPSVYDAIAKRYSCGWLRKAALEERKVPTTAITSSIAGSITVSTLMNRVSEHPDAPLGSIRYYQDAITLQSTVSAFQRLESCIGCSGLEHIPINLIAQRSVTEDSIIPRQGPSDGELEFSEAVLIRTACLACGHEAEYFESTRSLTDVIMICDYCGQTSIQTEFVHTLSVDEFFKLFSGKEVPTKFLTYRMNGQSIVFEMED